MLQIDGLAEPISAARWPRAACLRSRAGSSGSHRLVAWETGIPSMTSSGQAGILHGNNADIPAFRWYMKASRRLIVSNHPEDACMLEARQSTGQGLLCHEGSSLGNLLGGGATHAS